MEVKPGYKQTEVGVIPEDWESRRIGTVCRLINGRGFKPFEWQDTGLPIIRIQNLNGSEDFNFYAGAYDTKLEVESGQLLFAWSGSRGTSFGPHIWHGPLGLLNYHTWKVQVYETEIKKEFFLHALRQLTTFIEGKAHGASALVHTQKWEMERFQFPLPPAKAEQEAIAEALSDADALIESLEQLLTKKRQIKRGAMEELLTGKKRLLGFSGEWEVKRLEHALRVRHGRSHRDVCSDGKYPIFASGGEIGRTNSFLHDKPSVLIGRKGTIDHPQFASSPFWTIDTLFYTEIANGMSAKFLFYKFCMIPWRRYNEASGVPSLNAHTIENIEVRLPKSAEQTAIATILSDMDAEIAALEAKLSKARQIKQGMMQELLTGRTRLV